MIKGISRQVIEVIDTGNEYFERAILYVCPEFCDCEKKAIELEAKKMLRNLSNPSKMKVRKKTSYILVRVLLSALLGLVLGSTLTLLLV